MFSYLIIDVGPIYRSYLKIMQIQPNGSPYTINTIQRVYKRRSI